MKLTIEINTSSHKLERCIATSRRILDMLETLVDRAPGHPELPLLGIDAADPLKVAVDDPVEPVEALDWPALPKGIPAPPDGFAFVTTGILKVPADQLTADILEWNEDSGWNAGADDEGWHGSVEGPWAVRIGSDIAKANGII